MSQELTVAFDFAFRNKGDEFTPTLFVLSCQNYHRSPGMSLNSEAYTAYPSEGEMLLPDGTWMWVL